MLLGVSSKGQTYGDLWALDHPCLLRPATSPQGLPTKEEALCLLRECRRVSVAGNTLLGLTVCAFSLTGTPTSGSTDGIRCVILGIRGAIPSLYLQGETSIFPLALPTFNLSNQERRRWKLKMKGAPGQGPRDTTKHLPPAVRPALWGKLPKVEVLEASVGGLALQQKALSQGEGGRAPHVQAWGESFS